jgi:hypothetical protein
MQWIKISAFLPLLRRSLAAALFLSDPGGAKYWMTFMDAPYVPYVSLALTPAHYADGAGEEPCKSGYQPWGGHQFFRHGQFFGGHASKPESFHRYG